MHRRRKQTAMKRWVLLNFKRRIDKYSETGIELVKHKPLHNKKY
jgi:hypothetical protein